MDQMNLFDTEDAQVKQKESFDEFTTWRNLPDRTHVTADSPKRNNVCDMLRRHWRLYRGAHHVCSQMPEDRYIWLNDIEEPEYWVMNQVGEFCGEHVEKCPFCGADLKNGGGDVILLKTGSRAWRTNVRRN